MPALLSVPPAHAVIESRAGDGDWTVHEGAFDEAFFKDFKTTPTGFKYRRIAEGSGPTPLRGSAYGEGFQKVFVQYTAYLPDGTKVDSSYGRDDKGFGFRMGRGKVILGWEALCGGMREGAKLIAFIPAEYAYGPAGAPDTCLGARWTCKVPPDTPMVYYLEMVSLGDVKAT